MSSPEMLSAVANIVMAIMNITLFGIGAIALRNDRRRLSAVEESERRRFADEVFAWIEEAGSGSVLVQCRNGANSVIYDVRVALSGPDQCRVGEVYEIELMKPLEERSLKVEGAGVESAVAASVYFRDPAGYEWVRAPDGRILDAGAATALPPGVPPRARLVGARMSSMGSTMDRPLSASRQRIAGGPKATQNRSKSRG